MQITVTADVVAWYAAILSTLSLGVAGYTTWRDRPRVKVTARSGYKVHGSGHPYSPDKLYVSITVANRGRRPVTIQKVWLTVRGQPGGLVVADSLLRGPVELAEGKSVGYMLEQGQADLAKVRCVIAEDQTGQTWKGRLHE